ncbi:Tetratricopeptide repeat protein [Flagellimonas maritima]|uniref:histidine kinase n=1 Tax=Flagellimonas maritima TaxID=1383885 RepID=A0A2Z4LVI3_9FLAO|nr:ATP-binding protein [Allomuricauda aurantiaca]AWX45911.1 Tetratricopeptide repeat protein [Allomuricauda aurantiaca]
MPQTIDLFKLKIVLKNVVLVFCALFLVANLQAQKNKKDSLTYRLRLLESTNQFDAKDSTHIKLLINLAQAYRFINKDSLYTISNRALDYSNEIGYNTGKIMAWEAMGCYYSDEGNTTESLQWFKKALTLARANNNKKRELNIINNLAYDYKYEGNYAEALSLFLKGIDVAEQTDDKLMLSILNESIASLYAEQKDFKNAFAFYDKVLIINKELGNEITSAETQSNIATLYKDAKNFEYAMFNINKSISTFEKHKIYDWLAYAYEVKGSIYLAQNKYQWALYWYDQSNLLHEQRLDDEREEIQLLNGMAKVYLGLERDSISLQYAKDGFRLSKKIKSLQGQKDCSETLYKIHKNKGDFDSALGYLEVFKKLSDTLSKDKSKQSLSLLETKLKYEKEKQDLIASNKTALAKQRNYIYLGLVLLCISLIITFLVKRSARIQKKLNKELKEKSKVVIERESELHEINKTNTKLFSIIGHDLRGPIGALQGILKLFTDGDMAKEEFLSFIPKLKSDVDNIAFTLNNLLSWGQTQLNGVITKPKRVSLEKIVSSNIQLLSEIASGKSIKIMNQLPENPLIFADQNQIDIVVRNLLSNAIKFTPENGLITIEAQEKSDMWEIIIRDTGIGMNKEIQNKIFKNTTNITTYGTNNEKGTGLGLSLCKEMILKNKGQIWVESILRKGSSFHFTLPKAEKKYQQAS